MKDMIKKGQNISLKMTLLGNLFLIKKKKKVITNILH